MNNYYSTLKTHQSRVHEANHRYEAHRAAYELQLQNQQRSHRVNLATLLLIVKSIVLKLS